MVKGEDVLERSVIREGKVFIKIGEESIRAYVIQNGLIRAFIMDGEEKITVATFGPGTIIGEMGLVVDMPMGMNYEAVETTTVVTVTRQDFQKRLARADKTIKTVLDYAMKKIEDYEKLEVAKALKRSEVDDMALKLVQSLVTGMPEDKKKEYERAILPHINGLMKEIKTLKEENKKKTG